MTVVDIKLQTMLTIYVERSHRITEILKEPMSERTSVDELEKPSRIIMLSSSVKWMYLEFGNSEWGLLRRLTEDMLTNTKAYMEIHMEHLLAYKRLMENELYISILSTCLRNLEEIGVKCDIPVPLRNQMIIMKLEQE